MYNENIIYDSPSSISSTSFHNVPKQYTKIHHVSKYYILSHQVYNKIRINICHLQLTHIFLINHSKHKFYENQLMAFALKIKLTILKYTQYYVLVGEYHKKRSRQIM